VPTCVFHRRAQQGHSDADLPVATVDLETGNPPRSVIVGQHSRERPVAEHSRQSGARPHPCPADRTIIDVGDEPRRHDGVGDLYMQRVTLVRGRSGVRRANEDLTPARRSATTPPSEQGRHVVPPVCCRRSHVYRHGIHSRRRRRQKGPRRFLVRSSSVLSIRTQIWLSAHRLFLTPPHIRLLGWGV
jgi:hypothetical protein